MTVLPDCETVILLAVPVPVPYTIDPGFFLATAYRYGVPISTFRTGAAAPACTVNMPHSMHRQSSMHTKYRCNLMVFLLLSPPMDKGKAAETRSVPGLTQTALCCII